MAHPLEATGRLLRDTAKLARTRGLGHLELRWEDIGDLYHVYGVNASPDKLLRMLERRNANGKRTYQVPDAEV